MFDLKRLLISLSASALFLTGCGGGGGGGATGPTYDGLTTPTAITSTNAEEVSTKSAEAAEEAISQETANDANPYGISIASNQTEINPVLINIAQSISSQRVNLPVSATISYTELGDPNFCGGTITVPNNFDPNGTSFSMTLNSVCYNDPTLGQIIMNGTVTYSETVTEISIRYINFSITSGGVSETVNMTVTCDTSGFNCSISADYVGTDGKTYRIANMAITGSGTGPYTISATFYHPDHGSVSISGTGIYYACPDGSPSAGTINVTGSSGSTATVTITGCGTYSGSWDDGSGGTGMFSGTF